MEVKKEKKKRCSDCRQNKPLSSFSLSKKSKDGRRYTCKECDKVYRDTKLIQIGYHALKNLKHRHSIGIDYDIYMKLWERQKGRCAICGQHQTELKKALGVDHDHKTGTVRGLLCAACNMGLGYFKDSRGRLLLAIRYLGKR